MNWVRGPLRSGTGEKLEDGRETGGWEKQKYLHKCGLLWADLDTEHTQRGWYKIVLHSRLRRYKNLIPHCFFQRDAGQGHEIYCRYTRSSRSEHKSGSGPITLESWSTTMDLNLTSIHDWLPVIWKSFVLSKRFVLTGKIGCKANTFQRTGLKPIHLKVWSTEPPRNYDCLTSLFCTSPFFPCW